MNLLNKLTNFKYKRNTGLLNMTGEFFALFIKELVRRENKSILIVTPSSFESRNIYNKFLDDKVILFEDDEIILSDNSTVSPEIKIDRINALNSLIKTDNNVVITDIKGLTRKIPNVKSFKKQSINFSIGSKISRDDLIDKVSDFGYEKTSMVEKTGDFSVRGFIVDIFPINSDNRIRIEFFDDEVEAIRYFDLNEQTSLKEIDSVTIIPFCEKIGDDYSCIYDYLNDPIVVYKDANQMKVAYDKLVLDSSEQNYKMNDFYIDFSKTKTNENLYWFDFDSAVGDFNLTETIDFKTKKVPSFGENFEKINSFIDKSIDDKKTIIICVGSININNFLENLLCSYVLTDFDNIFENKVNVIKTRLAEGFSKDNYIILTDFELFGRVVSMHRKSKFKNTSRIRDLSKLDIGDYVVHSFHGIGVYNGIKTLKKGTIYADYLEILYAKEDKLYIPASKIELISKYNGKDGYVPKINALNSTSWIKTKQRIRNKLKLEAERLIKIQAEREVKKGFAFSKDTPMQKMFESEFAYEITADQDKASKEIKTDMEKARPMDRILCGDVGYGKTEVAFRAIFKAVLDGKQVLYLCPTTVLCRQQYEVACDRFKNYPVNIGILSRFATKKEIRETLDKLSKGKIDVLFATHRGLSDDVIFKDLGFLIVDEEQRFGVIQKEKIKEMKSSIDVLTLTATPIPRTLQMAILGIKELSLIETPPKNRKSVVTYVTCFDKRLIREIVYKEVSRGGQVFILYNKVEDIEVKVAMFRELFPSVSINFAHGKMPKDSFEKVMNDFVFHKFDVLVCTTIIETGIDIPNVNSLIIMDADRFGLSQLYQIRGRVGRSDTLAYAYLMYDKGRVMTEKAVKRLKVIKEFTELGSGFNIAAKDLSIRGAGDILGSEQAGFIDSVGIDLYLKMLDEEVNRIKGIPIQEEEEKPIVTVASHIKDSYVSEQDVKIEIHKLINKIDSKESLSSIKNQIEDRFGKMDKEMEIYLNEQLFESLCKKLGITKVFDNNIYREIIINKEKSSTIEYDEMFAKSLIINKCFKFSYKKNMLFISLKYDNANNNHVVFDFNKLFEELL